VSGTSRSSVRWVSQLNQLFAQAQHYYVLRLSHKTWLAWRPLARWAFYRQTIFAYHLANTGFAPTYSSLLLSAQASQPSPSSCLLISTPFHLLLPSLTPA
jgi:hypothetical protein